MKRALCLILTLCLLLLLGGCGVSRTDAQQYAEYFFTDVQAGDYETAAGLMHPGLHMSPEQLQKSLEELEIQYHIDLQAEVTIEKYTGFSSALYDSKVKGSQCTLTFRITVGGEDLTCAVTVVSNSAGKGISKVSLTLNK